jgi:hypothetical protein
MNSFGNLIGLAAEEDGTKRVAPELIIEESSLMTIARIQENTCGQIGEFKLTSRKQCPRSGKRRLTNNTLMMMRLCLKSSRR